MSSNVQAVQKQQPVATAPETTGFALEGLDPNQPFEMQLLTQPELWNRVDRYCTMVAGSNSAPKHVRGSPGTVLWALGLAFANRLSPMYVINCLFDPGNGRLGMMAELVMAALHSRGAIKGDLIWEPVGDWSILKGKWIEKIGKSGGKYADPTYTANDEKGLGMRVTVHWSDRAEPTTYPLTPEGAEPDAFWMSDMYPRFSTMWATNPQQQTMNVITRRLVRQFRPDVMHGMPVDEEAYDQQYVGPDKAKDISPGDRVQNMAEKHAGNKRTADKPKTEEEAKVSVWLNEKETSFEIDAVNLETVMRKALHRATSSGHAEKLWTNNQTTLNKLPGDVYETLGTYVEKRMAELDEPATGTLV